MYQIKWEFLAKNSLIPLVEIKGSAENIKLENIMIAKALSIIQQAECFKGRVMSSNNTNNTDNIKGKIELSFDIIFMTKEEMNQFLKAVLSMS